MLPEALSAPFDLYYTGLIGNLLMFVVGYLAASALGGKSGDTEELPTR